MPCFFYHGVWYSYVCKLQSTFLFYQLQLNFYFYKVKAKQVCRILHKAIFQCHFSGAKCIWLGVTMATMSILSGRSFSFNHFFVITITPFRCQHKGRYRRHGFFSSGTECAARFYFAIRAATNTVNSPIKAPLPANHFPFLNFRFGLSCLNLKLKLDEFGEGQR